VYGLPAHSRVWDAVKKAGGALSDGDVNAINLAAWVEDGSRIEVPPREAEPLVEPRTAEVQPNFESSPRRASVRQSTTTRTANRESTRVRKRAGSTRTRKAAALETLAKNPLDLNRADVAQLETLPGIGPAMAGRILEYRAENGGFKSVDDLDDVKGIGEAKMEKLRPLVMVR
jgi:competence protein ComEA